MKSFFTNLFGSKPTRRPAKSRKPAYFNQAQLSIEALEDRSLLAGGLTATLSGGILQITGTDAADTISVRQAKNVLSVTGVKGKFAASQVQKIIVNGRGGDDRILLNNETLKGQQPIMLATELNGGDGNDYIVGGLGNDILIGGFGNDLLIGRAGNDHLNGGAGLDTYDGGLGNNTYTQDEEGQVTESAAHELYAAFVGVQPTAEEQLFLELLNDARANPAAYGQSIGLDLSGVAARPALAFDLRLVEVARRYSQLMNDRNQFGHNIDGTNPSQRIMDASSDFRFSAGHGPESISAGYPDAATSLKELIIDTGIADLGHRKHLLSMDSQYSLAGVGILKNGTGTYKNYYSVETANLADSRPWLTGVVFQENCTVGQCNGRYGIGEGVGNITVDVYRADNGAKVTSTQTWGSGGYSIQLNPGTYRVTATLGGNVYRRGDGNTDIITIGSTNKRLNFDAQYMTSQVVPTSPEPFATRAASSSQIDLSWADSSGETGYRVYQWAWGTKTWQQIANIGANTTGYSVRGLNAGAYECFYVDAFNSVGSKVAAYKCATTFGGLTAPEIAATPVSSSQINLSWNDVAGETSYAVWMWTQAAGWQKLNTLAAGATSYTVSGLNASTQYWFSVGAANASETKFSTYKSATTFANASTAPAAPSLSFTRTASTEIDLVWSNVAGENGYIIQYWNSSTGEAVTFGNVGRDITRLHVTSANGFYYCVGAYNSVGTTYSGWMYVAA